jgi:tetratricopeptide (TPR) repeat protein
LKTNTIKSILYIALILALPLTIYSQDINAMFREAQQLEEARKEPEALKKYQEIIKLQPAHLVSLCKVSELYCLIGSRQKEKQAKMQYYKTAKRYAETALKINPDYSEANFVMSMAMGRMALILNGQEKITAVIDIKRYAEIAIRNDPSNFKPYHVLGKWHYEVSSLNAFERMGVKLLFGGFPPSSFAESIKYYERSRTLNPAFALNYLELGRVYRKNNQPQKAIDVLQKLQSVPLKLAEDTRIKREGNEILKALQQ